MKKINKKEVKKCIIEFLVILFVVVPMNLFLLWMYSNDYLYIIPSSIISVICTALVYYIITLIDDKYKEKK